MPASIVRTWTILCHAGTQGQGAKARGRTNLLGGCAADADGALLVADHHHGTEAELLAALDHLGHAADLDDTLLETVVLLPWRPVAAESAALAAASAASPLTAALGTALLIGTHASPPGDRSHLRPTAAPQRRTLSELRQAGVRGRHARQGAVPGRQ